jgi:hypothetical protein
VLRVKRDGSSPSNRGKPEGPPWPSKPAGVPSEQRTPVPSTRGKPRVAFPNAASASRFGAFRAVSTVRSGLLKSHVVTGPSLLNGALHSDTTLL